MSLFNPKDYQLPSFDEVNWSETVKNTGLFICELKISRERIGYPACPKINQYGEIREEFPVDINKCPETWINDFEFYQKYFLYGFSAIMHPYKPHVTERRRKVFIYRYLHGLQVESIGERVFFKKNIVTDESKISMIQFSTALDLLILK
ncbi:hypothetical protein M2139_001477 [Enterococcus sp. PF1-24]|uniref:transcriptional regulator, ArpU family protein n=1 Tax=unclassified Enterococcus TaxID=2608891 RepID=UPI002475A602|nr:MULTISPECIES: transcriptional regulator, ArpU family protein [unclassified Enterococcus]MDH6364532.1 hypothetical protein [Enterococcus sp. PFB1-1]MDH6401591.1 hypothetical protein [Enterococcus sp. PF1-24]